MEDLRNQHVRFIGATRLAVSVLSAVLAAIFAYLLYWEVSFFFVACFVCCHSFRLSKIPTSRLPYQFSPADDLEGSEPWLA